MMMSSALSLSAPGGHALRAGPAHSLSPLVSPSEGELVAPLSPSPGSTLDGLGPPSSASATSSAPPPLRDNPSLAEFVPMLTQGWAEIFIRRPSGMQTAFNINNRRMNVICEACCFVNSKIWLVDVLSKLSSTPYKQGWKVAFKMLSYILENTLLKCSKLMQSF